MFYRLQHISRRVIKKNTESRKGKKYAFSVEIIETRQSVGVEGSAKIAEAAKQRFNFQEVIVSSTIMAKPTESHTKDQLRVSFTDRNYKNNKYPEMIDS